MAAFTLTPVLVIVVASVNGARPQAPFNFTLAGWAEVFDSPGTLRSIGYSFLLTVRIPIAIVVAFVIAWLLVRVDLPARRFIETSLWLAFFLPPLPMVLGWSLLTNRDYGLINELLLATPFFVEPPLSINSVAGIIWVHLTTSTVPIMVLLLAPALRQFDASYEEAADVSGATTLETLRRITLPLLAPAILTAFVAGMIKSLEVFEVEQILGTPAGISVYAGRIYDLVYVDPPRYAEAMAVGTLFLAVLLIAAVAYQIALRKARPQASTGGHGVTAGRRQRTRATYLLSAGIVAFICVGVYLPLATLLVGSFNKLFGFFFLDDPWTLAHWERVLSEPRFVASAGNSLIVGLAAAAVGTLLYAVLAWIFVRSRVRFKGLLNVLVWLPWAIPGVLMGIALLWVFLTTPGVSALYGTLVPLIVVLILKELPLGTQMLRAAMQQVGRDLDEAAYVSGAGVVAAFGRIMLRLVAPMLVTVFMLVFVATLRDVGSVVFLAPGHTQTLPLLMFEYATSGAMESAAIVGVLIAAASTVMLAVALRFGLRRHSSGHWSGRAHL